MRLLGLRALLPAFFALSASLPSASAQTIQAVAQSARIGSPVSDTARTTLTHHLPPYALESVPSVPLNPAIQISGAVMILTRSPQVEAAFDQLLEDQQNPKSPSYHQWLTPQQVGELYGPAQSDVDAVSSWLTAAGMTVDSVSPSRLQITFSGSAQTMANAFTTGFRTYSLANGESRYSLTQEPSVPSAIAPVVSAIAGLSQVIHHPMLYHGELIPSAAGSTGSSGVKPQVTATDGTHYLFNSDFNLAFDVNAALNAGYTGSGQRIAVAGRARVNPTDVATVQTLSGQITRTFTTVIPTNGADPGAAQTTYVATNKDNPDQDEATIDINRSAGTATGAAIDLVASVDVGTGGTYATDGLFVAINYAINTLNDPILNISFGGCEAQNGQASIVYESSIFQQAASQGITTFVSSDDSGAAGCNAFSATIPATQQLSINDLCSSPYVTCVGGTEFADTNNPATYWSTTNNTINNASILGYIPEGAWNDIAAPSASSATYQYGGSGGGLSVYIARPSWQTGTGLLTSNFREVPDLALPASTHDGFVTCLAYLNATCYNGFFSFGGTSVAAPTMAGIQAIANQKLGGRQGNINPTLYKLAATPTNNVFHDTTIATSAVSNCILTTPSTCNNSTPAANSLTGGLQGYSLTAGWDAVTGWGSVDAYNYITAAAAIAFAPTTVTLTAAPTTITTAQTVVLTAKVAGTTGTPTGTVQFSSNGINLGAAVALVSGTATSPALPFTSAGTFAIVAAYSGDAAFAASSASLNLLVTAPALPATTTTLVGTASTITAQQTVGYTATVASTASGSPTGTVRFVRNFGGFAENLGAAIAVSGGKAILPATTVPAGTYSVTAVYSGDTNFAGSTSAAVPLTVTGIPTTLTLSPPPATNFTSTQLQTFTATLTYQPANNAVPQGTVQFNVDGAARLTLVVINSSGVASGSLYLSAGTHSITALYSGDTVFAPSNAAPITVTTAITPTVTTLTVPASVNQSSPTTLTATVSGLNAAVLTTASVTFKNAATGATIGTAAVSQSGAAATATLATTFTTATAQSITATYAGDASYATSTSTPASITINPVSIVLSAASPTVTLTAGAAGTDVVTATSVNFTGSQSLSCSVTANFTGASNAPVCFFTPASLGFTGSGSMTSTVNITSVASSAVSGTAAESRNPDLSAVGGVGLASLLLLVLPRRSRRAIQAARILSSFLLIAAIFTALSGCSGSSTTPTHVTGTSKGSYSINISTNSALNQAGNVGYSGTIALTIQ